MSRAEMEAARDEVLARRPAMADVVARCLVGWPSTTKPDDLAVYAGLLVKLDAFLSARPVETPTPAPTIETLLTELSRRTTFVRLAFDPFGGRSEPWESSFLDGGGLAQRHRAADPRSALEAALGDSSSQPSAPDPPASFKPFYGDE